MERTFYCPNCLALETVDLLKEKLDSIEIDSEGNIYWGKWKQTPEGIIHLCDLVELKDRSDYRLPKIRRSGGKRR